MATPKVNSRGSGVKASRASSPRKVSVKSPASSKASISRSPSTTKRPSTREQSPSVLIDARIRDLGDWRGAMLSRLRTLIKQAAPEVTEEWKWGTPVWSRDGIICTGETYKKVVKTTFARGAALPDPSGLFNSSLEGNVRRAIDFHEGDKLDVKALKALVRVAVALNKSESRQSK